MPGVVDLVPGHINFCGYVPHWASDFFSQGMYFFPSSIHKLYRACTNIGWAHEHFCRALQFQNHMPDGHVDQMLNAKPCNSVVPCPQDELIPYLVFPCFSILLTWLLQFMADIYDRVMIKWQIIYQNCCHFTGWYFILTLLQLYP